LVARGETVERRFISKMSTAKEFPPEKVRAIVQEVAALLKERKESVSVAETVCLFHFFCPDCSCFLVWCFPLPQTVSSIFGRLAAVGYNALLLNQEFGSKFAG